VIPNGQTVHTVQDGETLFIIAQQYRVTVEAIVAANELDNADIIYTGQQLIIPTAGSVVAPGTVPTVISGTSYPKQNTFQ
jgi:LysM repeat protein